MLHKILVAIAVALLLVIGYINFQPVKEVKQETETIVTPDEHLHNHDKSDHSHEDEVMTETEAPTPNQLPAVEIEEIQPEPTLNTLPNSQYLGSYTLSESAYETETVVSVNGSTRTITTNALPNHETGEFPGPGNPNSISAQDNSYTFPLNPTYVGVAREARSPGVGINGILFEPGTAERATCESGEAYRVVGLQDIINLGMDINNAHVQPTGLYHYHGSPAGLIEFADNGTDLVHVGFAVDGHLMYHSQTNAYPSSYRLKDALRSGTGCTISGPGNPSTVIAGTMPDGTYEEDWVYDATVGALDECNGIEIDGQYVYIVTDDYPFVGRCMMGEFTESTRGPGGPTNQAPQGQPGSRPTNR